MRKAILIIGGLLLLLFSVNNAMGMNGDHLTLATFQFLVALALFYGATL